MRGRAGSPWLGVLKFEKICEKKMFRDDFMKNPLF